MPISQFLRQFKNFLFFMEAKRCRQLKIPPKSILFPVIWVTNRCNLRCKMCDQWKADTTISSNELSAREWYSFVDSVSRMHATVVIITGGEPILREDIFDIIKYIRKKRIACHLCTNGTMLNEITVSKLKNSGLNSISVSLDSNSAEIHNRIRSVDCFDSVVKGIKSLRYAMPELKIGINYLITKQNFKNMHQMIPFVESLGVNQIKFGPIHTNLIHRHKNFTGFDELIFREDDLPELKFELDKLIRVTFKTKLLTDSRTFMEGMPSLYNGRRCRLRCYAGYISCTIDAFGRVSPCENFDGDIGLRDRPLEDIWGSSSFQLLRKQVDNCTSNCWDTTHSEINIRCSNRGFIKEFGQILKEVYFYF